jgi:hypothetical protein
MPLLFAPTIDAALASRHRFLWVYCPACRTMRDIDLRTLDRHREAAVTSLIPALSCRSRRPNAPLADTRAAVEKQHRRRDADRAYAASAGELLAHYRGERFRRRSGVGLGFVDTLARCPERPNHLSQTSPSLVENRCLLQGTKNGRDTRPRRPVFRRVTCCRLHPTFGSAPLLYSRPQSIFVVRHPWGIG